MACAAVTQLAQHRGSRSNKGLRLLHLHADVPGRYFWWQQAGEQASLPHRSTRAQQSSCTADGAVEAAILRACLLLQQSASSKQEPYGDCLAANSLRASCSSESGIFGSSASRKPQASQSVSRAALQRLLSFVRSHRVLSGQCWRHGCQGARGIMSAWLLCSQCLSLQKAADLQLGMMPGSVVARSLQQGILCNCSCMPVHQV